MVADCGNDGWLVELPQLQWLFVAHNWSIQHSHPLIQAPIWGMLPQKCKRVGVVFRRQFRRGMAWKNAIDNQGGSLKNVVDVQKGLLPDDQGV